VVKYKEFSGRHYTDNKNCIFEKNGKKMREKTIEIKYMEYDSMSELSNDDAYLLAKAREAANNAWAPYSNFRVGAALQLSNGKIVTGNNQENAAYPSGLCAERVALFAANANYPNEKVMSMAVTAFNSNGQMQEPVKPCGACRQAILESEVRYENPVRMILDGVQHILIMDGIKSLLPLSFEKSSL
jgi:cytidine deaminase